MEHLVSFCITIDTFIVPYSILLHPWLILIHQCILSFGALTYKASESLNGMIQPAYSLVQHCTLLKVLRTTVLIISLLELQDLSMVYICFKRKWIQTSSDNTVVIINKSKQK